MDFANASDSWLSTSCTSSPASNVPTASDPDPGDPAEAEVVPVVPVVPVVLLVEFTKGKPAESKISFSSPRFMARKRPTKSKCLEIETFG
jgi:hypothetical protein